MPASLGAGDGWTGVTDADKDRAAGRVDRRDRWDIDGRILNGARVANIAARNFSNESRWAEANLGLADWLKLFLAELAEETP